MVKRIQLNKLSRAVPNSSSRFTINEEERLLQRTGMHYFTLFTSTIHPFSLGQERRVIYCEPAMVIIQPKMIIIQPKIVTRPISMVSKPFVFEVFVVK